MGELGLAWGRGGGRRGGGGDILDICSTFFFKNPGDFGLMVQGPWGPWDPYFNFGLTNFQNISKLEGPMGPRGLGPKSIKNHN